ncbi:MAG: bifunctional enoyl-CoA hydratase/phosphate acetyltransferase [Spirochaetota bacterium]
MKTMEELIATAKGRGRKRVAVAVAQDPSALEAIVEAWKHGLAEPILVGDWMAIETMAASLGLDVSAFEHYNEADYGRAAATAVELVRSGAADVLMKGLLDTSILLKAALNKEFGINAGRLTSHVAAMEVASYHKLLFVTDAAINIAPDIPGKIDIIFNAVAAARALGVERPKVALLAAVEKVNWERMPCTVDAAVIVQMNRRSQIAGCLVDGPLALDNAVSAESARVKNLDSEVAGDADILVAPDIEAGNILYKCLLDLAGARGAGVVMGAAKPIVLTSRADSAQTKLASIALAALAS